MNELLMVASLMGTPGSRERREAEKMMGRSFDRLTQEEKRIALMCITAMYNLIDWEGSNA